jgi:peptidoglycan hydrolase CwlO-like protein
LLKNNKFDYTSIPYFEELRNTFEKKKKDLNEKVKNEDNTCYNLTKYEENLNPFTFVFSDGKSPNCNEKIDSLIEKMKTLQKKMTDCEGNLQSFDQKINTLASIENESKQKNFDEISQKIKEKCSKIMESLEI